MKKISHFIEKYHMITQKDYIIAGISGGADSVCLFFVLLQWRAKLGVGFTAVHVNHGLRAESANQDETFVRDLCEKYQVPFETFHVNLESIAKKRKQSLEEAGRMVRREVFETVRKKYSGTKIALAHHQNDNAETLLWNLSRGAGLYGMGGIRPVNGRYIRPLLCVCREEIEAFLRDAGQDFCIDETNADTEYTRNKLRHQIIPILEKEVNTQAVRHMNEAMEQIWEVQDYMDLQAEEAFLQCVEWREEQQICRIEKRNLEEYPEILQKMVIRRAMKQILGQMQDVGKSHIYAVLELFEKQVGRSLDLPFSMKAVRVYEGVELYQMGGEAPRKISIPLYAPGKTALSSCNLTVSCKIFPKAGSFSMKEIPEKPYTKWFDYDIIKKPLYIRTRQSGDYITIDHAGHRQKLKSWFVNEKIPAKDRDAVLCIADGSEIIWILGHRMSSAYQITEETKRILQIEAEYTG